MCLEELDVVIESVRVRCNAVIEDNTMMGDTANKNLFSDMMAIIDKIK